MELIRDGRSWQIGTAADVDWIAGQTTFGRTITAATPPIFDGYATFHGPADDAPSVTEARARTAGWVAVVRFSSTT
jgi:hypothetical protein